VFACLLFKHLSKCSKEKKLNCVQNVHGLCIEPNDQYPFSHVENRWCASTCKEVGCSLKWNSASSSLRAVVLYSNSDIKNLDLFYLYGLVSYLTI